MDALAKHGDNLRVLAGGTDLIPSMRQKLFEPEYVLDLRGIAELRGIRPQSDGGVEIGALTTIRAVERSEVLRDHYPVLTEAAATVASPVLRNMDVLRTAVSALSFYDPQEKNNDRTANVDKAIRLTSQIAMIVAAYDRIRKGKPVIEPDRALSHSANFLLMLNGKHPSATAERALDIALILHADHELNASTFAARVTAATLSDMHSAITSAIGALKGPLHGGANEAVFHILVAIDESGADAIDYIKGMLAQKKKIPGFGHRVYHTEDPRATHLRVMSRDLGNSSGQAKWFEISHKIEEFVKADKKLNANVDFYSASTYHTLGIDVDLFTPIFAVSRISGWTAHVIEQLDDNRLIRPRAEYLGPEYPSHYVAIDQR